MYVYMCTVLNKKSAVLGPSKLSPPSARADNST